MAYQTSTQRVDLNSFDELKSYALENLTSNMMSGVAFGRSINYLIQMGSAFGQDEVDRPANFRTMPGPGLSHLVRGGESVALVIGLEKYADMQVKVQQHALTLLLGNVGLIAMIEEIVYMAAAWGYDRRKDQINAAQA